VRVKTKNAAAFWQQKNKTTERPPELPTARALTFLCDTPERLLPIFPLPSQSFVPMLTTKTMETSFLQRRESFWTRPQTVVLNSWWIGCFRFRWIPFFCTSTSLIQIRSLLGLTDCDLMFLLLGHNNSKLMGAATGYYSEYAAVKYQHFAYFPSPHDKTDDLFREQNKY